MQICSLILGLCHHNIKPLNPFLLFILELEPDSADYDTDGLHPGLITGHRETDNYSRSQSRQWSHWLK